LPDAVSNRDRRHMSRLVAVCGSISADMIGYASRLPRPGETVLGDRLLYAPGGKGANVAVAAARLGAVVRFFGARGDDHFGEFIGGALAGEGVDVSSLAVVAGMHSGVALIAVDAQGENQILTLPGANGLVGAPDPCGAAVWFCPGEVPRAAHEGTLAAARADGATVIVNPSPANAIDPEVVGEFDIAIVNETELHTFAGHLPPRVVLTRGAAGAVLLPKGTELAAVTSHAVDTTGAGDAFAGAVCAGIAAGAPLEQAVQLALVTAAISVEREGTQPSYPRRDEVVARAAAAGVEIRLP
jgi:ribokinase